MDNEQEQVDPRKYLSFLLGGIAFSILTLFLAMSNFFIESVGFRRFIEIATFFSNVFIGIGIFLLYFKIHRLYFKQHREYLHKSMAVYEKLKSMMPEEEVSKPVNRIGFYRRMELLYWFLIIANCFIAYTNYPF